MRYLLWWWRVLPGTGRKEQQLLQQHGEGFGPGAQSEARGFSSYQESDELKGGHGLGQAGVRGV